jgi:5'-3' exonuclease
MGIPSYFSYIVKNHRNIIKKIKHKTKVHYFFLDSNSIVYDCLYKMDMLYDSSKHNEYEAKLIQNTMEKIDEYIKIVNPKSGVFISFDGVAPVAKLEQQRTRRHKSLLEYKLNKELNPEFKETWDKISITPGTEFMNKLNKSLHDYFKPTNSSGFNNISLPSKFVKISDSSEVGEGEHKIFEFMRTYKKELKDKSMVVYGLDADLIMLGINHLSISNQLYLFRETPEFIKSVDSSLEPNENYMVYLNELANGIVFHMKDIRKVSQSNVSPNLIKDYMFLCFMLGNDFLPHFPAVNIRTLGVEILMSAYKKVLGRSKKTIINDNKIQWSILSKVIEYLAENEHENFKREQELRERLSKRKYPSNNYKEQMMKYNMIPMCNRDIEEYINVNKTHWEERYYNKLLHCEYNQHNIKKICLNYLEGLEWTFNYYSGNTIDWNWKYNYHYPPLLKDLNKYVPNWNYNVLDIQYPENDINEYIQLAYVLPKEKLNYLPSKYHYIVLKELSEHYVDDYSLTWAYCKYMWESHPNLPHLDVGIIKDLFKNVN